MSAVARIVTAVIFAAIGCAHASTVAAAGAVRTGIDVLVDEDFARLAGQRIALITNHTGIDRHGQSSVRLLHAAPGLELVRIFSPEHGLSGRLDVPHIGDGTEESTGVPVLSLYGDVRQPTAAMLEGIDTLVFDIQDVGTRYYTYVSTMGLALEAAAEHDIRFVVLDRPNPINGLDVAGPVRDADLGSFVAYHDIAVRHGMTVGELARMIAGERGLDVELEVVELEGWSRADWFDETGLPWINPSPNIRRLEAAILYPGIGLLETTNVSVGRGTDTPFELVGAPWLDGAELAAALADAGIAGVHIEAAEFTPDSSTFAGELCHGVRFRIIDRERLDPLELGLAIARELAVGYPDTWDSDAYVRLLANRAALDAIRAGGSLDSVHATYAEGLETFRERREAYLLYR